VTLYYRGRILQTALLETSSSRHPRSPRKTGKTPGIVLRVEAALRRSFATLAERRRFDACIVCNHTVTRQAALTAAEKTAPTSPRPATSRTRWRTSAAC